MKALMIQGTASNVGKTIFVAGLCRALSARGIKVCPFKAQNITSNAYQTPAHRELGYAQYIQALACRVTPDSRINPVLIKVGKEYTDFILNGELNSRGHFNQYAELLPQMKSAIIDSYTSLQQEYDLMIIEGAGSPAEINFSGDDIANMWFADYFQIPVILIGNMEYGGSFASIAGTCELLKPCYRERIKGFLFNKYSGDLSPLRKGIQYIEERYGIRFWGAMPYVRNVGIPDEDRLFYHSEGQKTPRQMVESKLCQSLDYLADVINQSICIDELLKIE